MSATASDTPPAALHSPEQGAASAARPPLRIGLLLDSLEQPAWVSATLSEIAASGIAEFVLVILNDDTGPAPAAATRRVPARLGIWYRNRRHLPYALYSKLDERRYGYLPDPFSPV